MIRPVSGGIQGEGKATYGIFVDFVIESEEDNEASMCKKCMCRIGKNVIVWKAFVSCRESLRCQVLLDGEM
jgi:hypothetical protein